MNNFKQIQVQIQMESKSIFKFETDKDVGARSKGSCREIFKTLPFGNSWDKMDLTQQATLSGIGANIQIHILTQFTYYHLKSPTLI